MIQKTVEDGFCFLNKIVLIPHRVNLNGYKAYLYRKHRLYAINIFIRSYVKVAFFVYLFLENFLKKLAYVLKDDTSMWYNRSTNNCARAQLSFPARHTNSRRDIIFLYIV